MFHEYSSAGRARGSCITPRWISASTSPARNRSRAFLLRRSTWWCSMSLGRPGIGRRSRPTICQSRSWWSRRATSRPSRPLIPVITTLRKARSVPGAGVAVAIGAGAAGPAAEAEAADAAGGGCRSPEDMFAGTQPQVEHGLDPVLDGLHLLVEHLAVLVGIPGERHRLAEVEPVLYRQRNQWQERRVGHDRER